MWLELQSHTHTHIHTHTNTHTHTHAHTHTYTHGLHLLFASILGNTARPKWSLKLLSFLERIIATFLKATLGPTSGVSKRCNSATIF